MSKASILLTYFLILQQNLSKRLHSFLCTAILDIKILQFLIKGALKITCPFNNNVIVGIVVEIMQVLQPITDYFKCCTVSGVDCNLPTSA